MKEIILISLLCTVVLILASAGEYDRGYEAAWKDLSKQVSDDIGGVLLEGQYEQIPARTMILFKNIHMVQ